MTRGGTRRVFMRIAAVLFALAGAGLMAYAAEESAIQDAAAPQTAPTATSESTPAAPTTNVTSTPVAAPPVETRTEPAPSKSAPEPAKPAEEAPPALDFSSMVFVFMLATFIGLGVILRVSRLLHTPLMSLTNAISAIAVVGSIIITGRDAPLGIRLMGAVALFASMTNIISGFLLTDRMLKMFKSPTAGKTGPGGTH